MSIVLMPPAVRFDRPRRSVAALAVDLVLGRGDRFHQAARAHTTDALAETAETGSVDGWAADLELEGRHADHLVVNPAGAFVVTSVWHGVRLSGVAMAGHTAEASAVTAQLRSIIGGHGVTVPVRSIVAVWGAGASDVPPGGAEHDDVLMIRGSELAEFLRWAASFGTAWDHAQATDCLLDLAAIPAGDRVLVGAR